MPVLMRFYAVIFLTFLSALREGQQEAPSSISTDTRSVAG